MAGAGTTTSSRTWVTPTLRPSTRMTPIISCYIRYTKYLFKYCLFSQPDVFKNLFNNQIH